ncbi:hypothetical protein Tco_0052568 [Tanacetum coccineum]
MAQQIILVAQRVPKFQGIGRCNNYAMLQSIPCSPECKKVRPILLDHPLSYALTATADVPSMYLQQFWKTVSKVLDNKDTIRFKLDTQEIVYTVDMFRDTLKLPVETPDNPFVAPVTIEMIESFMQRIGYQGHDQTKINILQLFHDVVNHTNVDYAALLWWDFVYCVQQKKNVIMYPRFTKVIIADLMKKFPSISPRLEEDYNSIKDDILLVSVYTMGNVTVQEMLIPDAFLTKEIHATNDYKEYEMVFINVVVLMNQPQPVVSTQGMHRTTPRAHRIPTLTTTSGRRRKDEESYAGRFVASMLHDDVDDSGDRIEPGSHKERPEVVDDVDENKEEKKQAKKDDGLGSLKNRTEKMQTPIPITSRSPRKNL